MESNNRGIPKAVFVDKVENFVDGVATTAEMLLEKFNETLAVYKRMELSKQQSRRNLSTKLPELRKALDALELFSARKSSISTDEPLLIKYELCETLHANAAVTSVDNVCIWLGANVMLEYTLEEGLDLLRNKHENGQRSFLIVQEDLEFLREQITTIEVNIARVYNWDVQRRRRDINSSNSAVAVKA
jgi:prefoldin subunit 5